MIHGHVKYLLVGGGLASAAAAEAIRAVDADGSVLLVGQEITRPYHRPPLSKEYLLRRMPREQLFVHPMGWFADHDIELRTGRRVSHLDTARQSATLDSGEEISYDRLLLATGATAAPLHVPGADLPNLFYLRTLDDESNLHNALEKAKADGQGRPPAGPDGGQGRVAVIGAGLLGVELAAAFATMGFAVDLITNKPHPWRFAGEATGRLLEPLLQTHGVLLHSGAHVERLEGDGRVQRVVLKGKSHGPVTIPCDLAVAAVGARPNKELLRNTPIAAGRAILVDTHCRTNVPEVYAAGDCCAVHDPLFGKHRIIDHWDHARVTGAIAGRNMAGVDTRYEAVNWFFSEVFQVRMDGWGEWRQVDRRLLRGTPSLESPDFAEIGVAADGRVAQVLAFGRRSEHEALKQLVARRVDVTGKEDQLRDTAVPLQTLLP